MANMRYLKFMHMVGVLDNTLHSSMEEYNKLKTTLNNLKIDLDIYLGQNEKYIAFTNKERTLVAGHHEVEIKKIVDIETEAITARQVYLNDKKAEVSRASLILMRNRKLKSIEEELAELTVKKNGLESKVSSEYKEKHIVEKPLKPVLEYKGHKIYFLVEDKVDTYKGKKRYDSILFELDDFVAAFK